MKPRNRSLWPLAVTFALALAVAVVGSSERLFDSLRDYSRRRSLDSSDFGSRDLIRALGRVGAIHSRPHLESAGTREDGADLGSQEMDQAFSLDELDPEHLGRALAIDQEWIDRGAPTVSVQLDPADLAEIEDNLMERGREWERTAHFAWVEDGRVRFASRVGVRIHGAGGRRKGERYGHRIYFRRTYGADRLPGHLLDTGDGLPAKRIVLRRDGGPEAGRGGRAWHFTDAIAREMAHRIGLLAPHSVPAAVFVNGDFKGVRSVVERIDSQFLVSHFGHDNFIMARTKRTRGEPANFVKQGPPEVYDRFLQWAQHRAPIELSEVESRVDVDNLVRWTLLVEAAAVQDSRQGTALLDLGDPGCCWQWIPWDLNVSLGIWKGRSLPAADNHLRRTFVRRGAAHTDARTALIMRLLMSSDEFRTIFSTTFDEIYNHRLTRRWGDDLVERYKQTALRFGLDRRFLWHVQVFLKARPDALRQQLEVDLGFGPPHSVSVDVPPGVRTRIDGFDYERPYRGLYTEGSILRLDLDRGARNGFLGWQIGERLYERPDLEIEVVEPMVISLRLSGDRQTVAASPAAIGRDPAALESLDRLEPTAL